MKQKIIYSLVCCTT